MPSDPGYYHETEKQPLPLPEVRDKYGQLASTIKYSGDQNYLNSYAEGAEKTGIMRTVKYTDELEYPKTTR